MENITLRAGSILLIMYNRNEANTLAGRLEGYGYSNIDICLDSKTLFEKPGETVPEIIICELHSGENLNVIKNCKLIRDKHDIPVIYISESQNERSFKKVMETHPHALLSRPLNWDELRVAIESALYRKDNSNISADDAELSNQRFENADVAFQVMDPEGNLLSVNRAWIELTGFPEDEIKEKWFGDILTRECRNRFKQNFTVLKEKGIIQDLDYTLLRKDRHELSVSLTCLINVCSSGDINSIYCILKDTTDKELLRKHLGESEERYRKLFEDAPFVFQSLSEDGRIISANRSWLRMLGYDFKEVRGKYFGDFLAKEDKERFQKNFQKFKLEGKACSVEYKMVTKHGNEISVSIDGKLHHDEKGNCMQSYCILKDVTKQKQLEQSMSDQLAFFEAINSCPQLSLYIYDFKQEKNIWASQAQRDLMGGILRPDPAEADLKAIYDEVHPDDIPIIQSTRKKLLNSEDKQIVEMEYRMRYKGNQWRNYRDRVCVFKRDENGRVCQILGISMDITDMIAAQDTLKRREREISLITDNSPALVSYLDNEGRYRYVNKLYEDWFGIPREDFIGRHYSEMYGKEASRLIGDYANAALSGQEVSGDVLIPYALGGDRYVSLHYIPQLDEKGRVEGFHAFVADITDRQKALHDLQESENKYRSLVESMDDMVFSTERNGSILTAGGKSLGEYGLDAQGVIGKNLKDLFGKEVFTQETGHKAFDEGISSTFDLSVTLNGCERTLSITSFPIRDITGKVQNAGFICRDQTELKYSESALQRTEQWLYTVLNNAPITIFAIDNRGVFTFHKGKQVEAVGMKPGENVGVSAFDLYGSLPWIEHDGTVTNGRDVLRRALKGEKVSGTTELNGVHFDNRLSPVFDKNMNMSGVVGVATDITARMGMERALKIALEKYRVVFETFPVGISIIDASGQIQEANLELERILGLSRDGHRQRSYHEREWQTIRPDGTPMPSDEYASVRVLQENRRVEDVEMGIIDSKGKVTWVNVTAVPMPLEGYGAVIAYHDITEKKAAEEALMESERRYKDLVDKAGIAIITKDVEGNISYFNRAFAKLFGYTMSEMKKLSPKTLVHSEDLQRKASYHEKRMKGEKAPEDYEIRGIHKNGNEIWMQEKITLLKQGDKITGTRNYLWNITGRKKMVQDLVENEARFRELYSNMSSGVAIYKYNPESDKFILENMNKAGMRICRVKREKEVKGRDILTGFPDADRIGLLDAMKQVWSTNRPAFVPASHYRDEKLELYVENRVYKLPAGEIVCIFDDVSARIEAEHRLKISYQQIKSLSRHTENIREEERKMIARNLHDELGQILTAIKMDVSWIRAKLQHTERTILKSRASATIQIIDRALREVSRLSSELRPRILDDLGLKEALEAYIKEYEKHSGIAVHTSLPGKEPDPEPGMDISIYRIIQEALTNVARHSRATRVDLIMKVKRNNLEIRIIDNGRGISASEADAKESYGIISMRERVYGMGGTFDIRGSKGQGTHIHILIPFSQGLH